MAHRRSCVCFACSFPAPSFQAALLVLLPDWCCCAGAGSDKWPAQNGGVSVPGLAKRSFLAACLEKSRASSWRVCDATGLTWETPVGSTHASGRYFLPGVEWPECCLIPRWNKFHSFGLCSYQTLLTANFPACNSILKSVAILSEWLLKCFQVVPGLQLYELLHPSQIWISWCFSYFRFLPKTGIFGERILVLVFPFYF